MPRRGAPRGGRGGKGGFGDIKIVDSVRIAVNLQLKNFKYSENENELEFPTSLTRLERAYVHKISAEQGMKSKSRGNGQNRYITVYKNEGSTIVGRDAVLSISQASSYLISELLSKYPVSARERVDLLPISDRSMTGGREIVHTARAAGRLAQGTPRIPENWGGKEYLERRQELPIWNHRAHIIQAVNSNQIVLVTGETGSGKTTQVPQYLLEDAYANQKAVRVVVCEPRRLAAVTVSERVAQERDEEIGVSIGYQIRLDSCTSAKNMVTFCTYGVLLRSLMGGDHVTSTLTHIIIDEVHERDKLCDFLLTVLREVSERNLSLKIILMSATVDTQQFVQYFNGIVEISVPGRMFPVEEHHLEDILVKTNYKMKGKKVRSSEKQPSVAVVAPSSAKAGEDDIVVENVVDRAGEPDHTLDALIGNCFLDSTNEGIAELFSILETDIARLNYQHSERGVSILMLAAARGALDLLEFALEVGANVHLKAGNGWTALDFARNTGQGEAAKILEAHLAMLDDFHRPEDTQAAQQLREEQREMLEDYQNSFDEDDVDHNLIVQIIKHIHKQEGAGAVLVFLPGYEDIINIKDEVQQDAVLRNVTSVVMLHSQMASAEHKKAFKPAKAGLRKVILSTNIAETGVTLDDVVFVIDSGKVKEKSFDAISNSTMLKSDWISQSSATQRKGRAGRCQPGKVYRLFSSIRYSHLSPYQTPEILRTPLLELCLQTKLLAPPNTPIADFLAKVPEPPAFLVTRSAVQWLKTLEALDQWEEVTPLGSHLLDIPLDPVYGKIVLHGVVLRCLDPVLTICSSLSYRDPFLVPMDSFGKKNSDKNRKRLSENSYSDHKTILNAFKEWDTARQGGRERAWASKNNVSNSTMEMISGMKKQVMSSLKQAGFVRAKAGGYHGSTSTDAVYNTNSSNWSVIKACLVAGLYPNLARFDREAGQLRTMRESKVKIHPGSVCADLNKKIKTGNLPSDWLVFTELTRVGRNSYIRGVSFISAACVGLLTGPTRLPVSVWETGERTGQVNEFIEESSDSEEEEHSPEDSAIINLDPWISLRTSKVCAQRMLSLRQKWTTLWQRKLASHHTQNDEMDSCIVGGVAEILQQEDAATGLAPPSSENRVGLSELMGQVRLTPSPRAPPPPQQHGQHQWSNNPAASQHQPDNSVYFIVRPSSGSLTALEAAMSHGPMSVWTFAPSVDRKLMTEVQQGNTVVVLFNVAGTHHFQGSCLLFGQTVREGNRVGQRIRWLGRQYLDLNYIGALIGSLDLQPGKDIFEIPSQTAVPILNIMNTTNPAKGNDRGGNRRGRYMRRN